MSRFGKTENHSTGYGNDSWKDQTKLRLDRCQYDATVRFISRDMLWSGITDNVDRILDCIKLGVLTDVDAIRFATKHLDEFSVSTIRDGKPPKKPPPDVVRLNWKKIPPKWMTTAEFAMYQDLIDRISPKIPTELYQKI